MNEQLNTALYEKMFAEQETYREWLLTQPPVYTPSPKKPEEKILLLPQTSRCATHAVSYLTGRGIDSELIDFCIFTGRLYESRGRYHNVFS